MKTIFGLFDKREQAEAVAEFARRSSIDDQHLKVLDSGSPAHDLVEPSPRPRTWKGIRGFMILGTLIFGVFGAFAAVGSITSTGAPVSFAVQVLLLFLLIGFFSGVGLGFVKGRSDAEEEIQRFREAFGQGAVMKVCIAACSLGLAPGAEEADEGVGETTDFGAALKGSSLDFCR